VVNWQAITLYPFILLSFEQTVRSVNDENETNDYLCIGGGDGDSALRTGRLETPLTVAE